MFKIGLWHGFIILVFQIVTFGILSFAANDALFFELATTLGIWVPYLYIGYKFKRTHGVNPALANFEKMLRGEYCHVKYLIGMSFVGTIPAILVIFMEGPIGDIFLERFFYIIIAYVIGVVFGIVPIGSIIALAAACTRKPTTSG